MCAYVAPKSRRASVRSNCRSRRATTLHRPRVWVMIADDRPRRNDGKGRTTGGLAAHHRRIPGVARAPAGALGIHRWLAAPDGAGVDDAYDHREQRRLYPPSGVGRAGVHCPGRRPADRDRRDLRDSRCPGHLRTADLATPVVAEPAIIVEVMFPASEADDTGRKWLCYQKIPSLKHYLVLAQDRCLVQVHSRAGDLWRERFERRHDRARRSPPPPGRRRPLRPDRPRGVDRPILRRNDGKGPRRNNT